MATTTNRRPDTKASDNTEPEQAPAPKLTEQLQQALEEGKRLTIRYRRQLTPLAVMGVTNAIGAAAYAAPLPGDLAVLAAAGVGTGIAFGNLQHRVGKFGRAYLAVTCAASWTWEATAAMFGAGPHLSMLLWLGGSAAAVPWWLRHSEPTPDTAAEEETPEPEPEPQAPPEIDPRSQRWGRYLGGRGKKLEGSKLSDFAEMKYGWSAVVSLERGEHWSSVAALLWKIASVFDLEDGRVLVEPIPGQPVHKARLYVLIVNPLESIIRWPGPGLDPEEGTFPLALTADGEMLNWRMWWPGGGMCHGLIAGTTGSGKSSTIDLVLSEIVKSDRLVPIVIDGSGGASVPDWLDHVEYKATTVDETIELLMRVIAAMEDRFQVITQMEWTDKKGRRRKGRHSIDPTPQMPGLVVVVDEAHKFLMDAEHGRTIRRLLEIIAQMGRKVAVALVLATQQASVTQLGGSSVLRDMCKSGNIVALRTAEKTSGGFVGSTALPEGLHELPPEWPDGSPTRGLGYIVTARAIRSRVVWVEDPYDNAENQTPTTVDLRTREFLDGAALAKAAADAAANGGSSRPARADYDDAAVAEFAREVEAALARGVDKDPFQLARATGLTWTQVKTALNEINATTTSPA